jgi:hypothetical protein
MQLCSENLGLHWDSNSYNESSLGSVKVHSLTLFALSRTCNVTPGSFFWPATLQPLASVTSPRLRLRHMASYMTISYGHANHAFRVHVGS